jgi:hypothetical protein
LFARAIVLTPAAIPNLKKSLLSICCLYSRFVMF